MKKIFLFLVIFALSFGAKAQTWTPIFGKQRFASGLGIPTKDSTYFAGTADSSLIYINPKDAGLYYKYKGYHKKVGTGTVSSVSLSMPSAFSVSGSPITNNGTFIVTGAGSITQYIRGDGSLATLNTAVVPESGNLYYTDARARAAISGTSPISVTSGVVSISQASGSTNGYLSATDWTTFNSKQTQLNGTGFVKQSGTTTSYDNTTYYPASNPNGYTSNTGTVTSVALTAPSAFTVTGSPVTTSGTLAIAGAGNSTQYIDGSGSLQTFPTMLSSDNLIKLVRNQSGATMTAGTIVYIDGATGNKPTIAKALATSDATSAQTYGAVQADIANNADGYIVVIGNINNLNTSGLTEGAQLYLSSTTAGTYTTTKQYAPAHLVYVGIVLRAHPTQGIIGVKIQNGYELDELHNVAAQTPSNNDGLFYESSTSLWKNKSISTVLGYTPQSQLNGTGFVKASGTTISYDNSTYLTTTSAASTYVPYTGATTDVLLGAYKLKANSVYAEGSGGIGGALQMKQYSSAAINEAGYSSIGTGTSGIFYFASATTAPNFKNFALNPSGLADNTLRTYTLPDASGTLALTSNLSSYVPYTGATSAVNIGNNVLTSGYSILNGSGLTNEAGVLSLLKGTSRAVQGNGYTNLYAEAGKVGFIDWITGNVRTFELSLASLTAGTTRVYTLPDASGTIALTSNLSGYVTGSGTSGILPIWNGTNSLTLSQVFDNGSTVSIGNSVTSPNKLVSFSSNASGFAILGSGSAGAGGVYAAITSGTGNMFQGSTSNGGYFISDNVGNTYISGKVGIGTFSSSSYNLNVVGTGYFSGQLWASLAASGTPLRIDAVNGNNVTSNTKLAIGTGGQYGSQTNKKFLDIDFNGYNNYTQARIRSWDENGSTGYGSLYFYTNGAGGTDATTLALSLNYNGAATFSSSVTAAGEVKVKVAGNYGGFVADNNSSATIGGGFYSVQSFGIARGLFSVAGAISGTTDNNVGIFAEGGSGMGAIKLYVNGSGTASHIFAANGTVGIGTTSPTAQLQVSTNSTSQPAAYIEQNANYNGLAVTSSGNAGSYYIANFRSTGIDRMRILDNGTVLINTNTDPGSSKLYVNGIIRANDGVISTGGSASLGTQSRGGNGYYYYWIGYNTELKLYYDAVGFIGQFNNSTGVYTPLSDKNKKKDFEISNIGLKEILQLKPTLYRMKSDTTQGEKELGFIAQDVKDVIPNAYVENKDFIGLNYNPIVAALTKAIQELNQKITNLEAQIKQ